MSDLEREAHAVLAACAGAGVLSRSGGYLGLGRGAGLRWLVPSWAPVAAGVLAAWRPYGTVSRTLWSALRLWHRLGASWLPGAVRVNADLPQGSRADPNLTPVIYVGTPGPRQKAVCHIVDATGRVATIVKVPLGPDASAAIIREAEALERLSNEGRVAAPRLTKLDRAAGVSEQTWLDGRPSGRRFTRAHADFLASLRRSEGIITVAGQSRRTAEDLDRRVPVEVHRRPIQRLLAAANEETPLPAHWVHGDFAPWNLKVDGRRLVACDWEEADPEGLPLQDLAHFFVTQGFLFRWQRPPLRVLLADPVVREFLEERGYPRPLVGALLRHYCAAEAIRRFERGEVAFGTYALKCSSELELAA